MAVKVFYLVLTFYAGQSSAPSIHTQVLPNGYASEEACAEAGRSARSSYTGGIKVDWACVPS